MQPRAKGPDATAVNSPNAWGKMWGTWYYNMNASGVDTSPQSYPLINTCPKGHVVGSSYCIDPHTKQPLVQCKATASLTDDPADCHDAFTPTNPEGGTCKCVMEGGNCIACVNAIMEDRCGKGNAPKEPPFDGKWVNWPNTTGYLHGQYNNQFADFMNKQGCAIPCTNGKTEQGEALLKQFCQKVKASSKMTSDGPYTFIKLPIVRYGEDTPKPTDVLISLGHGTKSGTCGSFSLLAFNYLGDEKRPTYDQYVLQLQIDMRAWSLEMSVSNRLSTSGNGCIIPQESTVDAKKVMSSL